MNRVKTILAVVPALLVIFALIYAVMLVISSYLMDPLLTLFELILIGSADA